MKNIFNPRPHWISGKVLEKFTISVVDISLLKVTFKILGLEWVSDKKLIYRSFNKMVEVL